MSIDESCVEEKQIIPMNSNKFNVIQKIFENSIFGKFNKSNEAAEKKQASLTDNINYFDGVSKDSTDQIREKTLDSNNFQNEAVYMPEISRVQYVNRHDKLKDIKRFIIKDSKTDFVLI